MSNRVRTPEYLQRQREYRKAQNASRRNEALIHLGGRCVVCGSTDRLEIDHIDRTTKRFPISRPPNTAAFWEELAKCQLLCYGCHREKSGMDQSCGTSPLAKLSNQQVIEIRDRLARGESGASLAREYGVGPMQISRIKHRQRWKRLC